MTINCREKNIIVKTNNCLSDIKTTIYENSLKKCLSVILKNLNINPKTFILRSLSSSIKDKLKKNT